MPFDHDTAQEHAGAQIERFGQPAQLLRGGVLRDCTAAVLDYNPRARGLNLDGAERALVSGLWNGAQIVAPDHELDKLIQFGKLYDIPTPVKGPRPGGTVIFFDLDVIYNRAYP